MSSTNNVHFKETRGSLILRNDITSVYLCLFMIDAVYASSDAIWIKWALPTIHRWWPFFRITFGESTTFIGLLSFKTIPWLWLQMTSNWKLFLLNLRHKSHKYWVILIIDKPSQMNQQMNMDLLTLLILILILILSLILT